MTASSWKHTTCQVCSGRRPNMLGIAGAYSVFLIKPSLKTNWTAQQLQFKKSPHDRNDIKHWLPSFLLKNNAHKRLRWLRSVKVEMSWPSGPTTRWVAFHWALWTLQLDKHSPAHSAGLAVVCAAQTGPMASFCLLSFFLPQLISPSLLENKKTWRENMTPGSCALCPGGYKSRFYGGLCLCPLDLCAPSFPSSHPDHRTIFRRGD